MKDMKRTKADKAAEKKRYTKPMAAGDGESYPYGLHVSLDHESLKKLGMKSLPKVGDKLHMKAHAHVTEVSEDHRDGENPRRSVRVQLRKMALGAKESKARGYIKDEAVEGAKKAMDKALNE